MPHSWFRFYGEFCTDPKVQMMPEFMQRRLVMIFCMRSNETLQERSIAFQLRISESEVAETKQLFIDNGFIDQDWNVVNWNKRQFVSDTSTDRVRRFRSGKKQSETFPKRRGNGIVTPPDTDTDTDTDTELSTLASSDKSLPAIGSIPLVSGGAFKFTQADVSGWSEAFPAVDVMQQLREMREWSIANPSQKKTPKGIRRFIVAWLGKEQDKGGKPNGTHKETIFERNIRNLQKASERLEDASGAGHGVLPEPEHTGSNGRRLPERVGAHR